MSHWEGNIWESSEGGKEVNYTDICRKTILGRQNSPCKECELVVCQKVLKKCKEASVAGVEWAKSSVWRQKVKEGPDFREILATVVTSALLLERWGDLGPDLGFTGSLRLRSFRCREWAARTRAEGWSRAGVPNPRAAGQCRSAAC